MSRKKRVLIALLLFFLGAVVLLYPFISNLVNEWHGSYAIAEIQQVMDKTEASQIRTQKQQAESYNRAILNGITPENYEKILDISGGMMGYIRIPSISVNLPIYHGVGEDVLSKGVGHMPKTAFPIGGEGNHTVLTGHTGLPSAKLFTDLAELTEGDKFYIHVLNDVLVYQIDQIKVVLPSDGNDLAPDMHKDFCTLVTCTPYGVNSHRLLVRGVRLTEEEVEIIDTQKDIVSWTPTLFVSGIVIILSIGAIVLLVKFRRKGKYLP